MTRSVLSSQRQSIKSHSILIIVTLMYLQVCLGDVNSTTEVQNKRSISSTIIPSLIPCNETNDKKTSPCPISAGLTCSEEGFCKCAYPNLTLDAVKQRCVAGVGDICGFRIGQENASIVSCPENAVCALVNFGQENESNVHKCLCIYTHYLNEEGKCVPKPSQGQPCDSKRTCVEDSDLICSSSSNGTCQCQFPNDQYFDKQVGKCISYAGGNCTRFCVSNAICDFWQSGICKCRVDYRINEERQCEVIRNYLSPCLGEGEKDLCNKEAGLKCLDNVCQCANPLHQFFDFKQEKCIGLVGDMCDPQVEGNCFTNSKCRKNAGSEHHTCQCEKGYSTTPFRKCMKTQGEKCSNEFCNVYRGLACIRGTCDCYDSFLRYDNATQACLSPIGSPCGKIYVPFPGDWIKNSCPDCDSYYFACDEGAVCKRDFSQNDASALEKFRCQSGTVDISTNSV